MVAVVGVYQNGQLKLDRDIAVKTPLKVIVTFIDEPEPFKEKRLTLSDFSFTESNELLKDVTGSFSDALIEERRSEI